MLSISLSILEFNSHPPIDRKTSAIVDLFAFRSNSTWASQLRKGSAFDVVTLLYSGDRLDEWSKMASSLSFSSMTIVISCTIFDIESKDETGMLCTPVTTARTDKDGSINNRPTKKPLPTPFLHRSMPVGPAQRAQIPQIPTAVR